MIYISQKLSYKNKPELQIYHPKHLESTFTEILLPDKSNFIIGTVCKHPTMIKAKAKNSQTKQLKASLYKKYSNIIVDLLRKSKKSYYRKYFENSQKKL